MRNGRRWTSQAVVEDRENPMGMMTDSHHVVRRGTARGMIVGDTLAGDLLATKEFTANGTAVRVMIGRPERYATGRAWRCQVRIERGTSRLEQSQVVAVDESAVVRQALDLVTSRLGVSETEFFEGATLGPGVAAATGQPRRG
ncbi:hypothetical protein [Nocardia australiensis]|uniref:hypothetical protein n=1 Tax=Nocardia australiensis TaxID=2887191 RepID=UPI001D143755|nr:hypothetical protein [Nocardia australiensis]